VVNEQLSEHNQLAKETRQERREKRRAAEKARTLQHGKSLARIYKDAVSKKARATKPRKQPS